MASWDFKSRLKSFKYAFNGFSTAFKGNPNFTIQFIIAIAVIILSIVLNISKVEWLIISFLIVLVLTLEMINTAIENVSDAITKKENQNIRKAKDLAAAAVLLASVFSAIAGVIVFLPKILDLLNAI